MATAPPDIALAAILAPVSYITRRVEIYESDGVTRWTQDTGQFLEKGSVNIDSTRDERRTIDLELYGDKNELIHNPNGFWYDKIIKPFRGVIYSGGAWETQIGEFMIDRIAEANEPQTVKVTGRDYTKKLLVSKFAVTTGFNNGASIENTIRTIFLNGGITKFIFPVTGRTLGKDFIFEAGTERWKAGVDIATAYGYELFFDNQGYCVMREFQDPLVSPLTYTFGVGNTVKWDKQVNDSRLYNSMVVSGESNDSIPVVAKAQNTQPDSPSRIARIGERLYRYTSPFITTQAQAQDVANKFLKIYALEEFELNLDAIVQPWLEAGDIVGFTDPMAYPGQPNRFLLSSLTIPLGLDSMSANAKRVSIVG